MHSIIISTHHSNLDPASLVGKYEDRFGVSVQGRLLISEWSLKTPYLTINHDITFTDANQLTQEMADRTLLDFVSQFPGCNSCNIFEKESESAERNLSNSEESKQGISLVYVVSDDDELLLESYAKEGFLEEHGTEESGADYHYMKSCFVVRRMLSDTRRGIFALIEKTNLAVGTGELRMGGGSYQLGNEWRVLTHVHGNLAMTESGAGGLQTFAGIIPSPEVYVENVRVSLLYPCYPMDLFTAINNYASVKDSEGVSEEIATIWLFQLLQSLQHMEQKRVLHRGLKSENICVDNNGNCVICHFDSAYVVPDIPADERSSSPESEIMQEVKMGTPPLNGRTLGTNSTMVVSNLPGGRGTPFYTAPENWAIPSRFALGKSDLWSIGVIAIACVSSNDPWNTGLDPMEAASEIQRVNRIIQEGVLVQPEGVSEVYFDFVKTALEVDLNERASVGEAVNHALFDGLRNRPLWQEQAENAPHEELVEFCDVAIRTSRFGNNNLHMYNVPDQGIIIPESAAA